MSSLKIVAKGVPPSVAKARRPNGTWYRSPKADAWDEAVATACAGRIVDPDWKFYSVKITVEQSSERGKLACRIKLTLDALTHCGFWKDDAPVASIVVRYGKKRIEPRVVIEVSEAKRKWKR